MRLEWSVLSPAWQTSIAVVLATGGMVSGEARQDTQMLILTKPASRATYVAAMFGIQADFLVVTTLGAGVIELAVSRLLFPDNPVAPLVATTSAWLVLALVLLAPTLVGSVSLGSPLATSGVSLVAMVVMLLLTLREPVERYSPTGLTGFMSHLAAGETVEQWWPAWTGLACVAAGVTLSVVVFRRREL